MENHGKRNLIILGVGALLITIMSTSVSLWIYRSSGDIYLDRSRPGYLPDENEVEQDPPANSNYTFSETGELTKECLKEYLEELKNIDDRIKALADPYSSGPLSDESLGISSMKAENDDAKTEK